MTRRRTGSLLLLLLPFLLSSCAYYNTFYHARVAYDQAEKARAAAPEDRRATTGLDLYEEALKKSAKVIVEYPGSRWVDDAMLLMGQCFYAKGDHLAAVRKFDEILLYYEKSPLVREARFWKAKTLVELERYDEALPILEEFREKGKGETRAEALFLLSRLKYRRGKYDEAVAGFLHYAEKGKDPTRRDRALDLLGDSYRRMKEPEKAYGAYQKRLDDPLLPQEERLRSSLEMAELLAEQGRFEEAHRSLDDIEKEVRSNVDSLRIDLKRSRVLLAEKKTEEAVSFMKTRLDSVADSEVAGEMAFLLGEVYIDSFANKDSAAAAFRKVAQFPGDEDIKTAAARRARFLSQNLELKQELAEGTEDTARVWFLLAENELLFFGEIDSALARYRRVAERFPGSPYAAKAIAARVYLDDHEGVSGAPRDSLLLALVRNYPKSKPAIEYFDRGEVAVPRDSLDRWTALYEEANPEPDSTTADSTLAGEELPAGSEGMIGRGDAFLSELEGPPAPLRLEKRVEPTSPLLPEGTEPIGGEVEVEVEVDGEGRVRNARILRSSDPRLEGPALAAAYQCRYLAEGTTENRTTSIRFAFQP